MPRNNSEALVANALLVLVGLYAALLAWPLAAKSRPKEEFTVSLPVPAPKPASNGGIFQAGAYVPLTSGARAGMIGDIITISLVERTSANKANSASTGRNGTVAVTPPPTGPLSFFRESDLNMGGDQSFKGSGSAAQSNSLSGEISVTIAAVYPNGNFLVRGEKQVTLNRGDELVQISGIIRPADISADNRVLSTRVSNARILYIGKGEIARASKQGWLQQFFSTISPF